MLEVVNYDWISVSLPVIYFRFVVKARNCEPMLQRVTHSVFLASLSVVLLGEEKAGWKNLLKLLSVELGSYILGARPSIGGAVLSIFASMLVMVVYSWRNWLFSGYKIFFITWLVALYLIFRFLPLKFEGLRARFNVSKKKEWIFRVLLAAILVYYVQWVSQTLIRYLVPLEEFGLAWNTAKSFTDPLSLEQRSALLVYYVIHIQVAIGYQGIWFIREGQIRSNMLLKVEPNNVPARSFVKSAVKFIILVAVPYCAQRTFFETLEKKFALRYIGLAENDLRLRVILSDLPTVSKQDHTASNYVKQYRYILENSYHILKRKLFSLPKLTLLPSIVIKHPVLCVGSLPLLLGIDYLNAKTVALMTEIIEDTTRKTEKLESVLLRVETHDSKNAGTIDRAGDMDFVYEQWSKVSGEIQRLSLQTNLLSVIRRYSQWLYRQDVVLVTIQCGIAYLLEWRDITVIDIFVYSRVIEDGVDLILTRSRAEAELARIRTNGDRLAALKDVIVSAETDDKIICSCFDSDTNGISISFDYTRGNETRVKITDLNIEGAGVFAVVGPNGSGKSTFFALLLACTTDGQLPPGVVLTRMDHIVIPTKDISIISQDIYCPLHVVPNRWITKKRRANQKIKDEDLAVEVVELAKELKLKEEDDNLLQFLMEENDDFCDALSGGELVKMELIRTVFLLKKCPRILLLDETFAPLDPESKSLVMRKLRAFCHESIILVIFHPGADNDKQSAETKKRSLCSGGSNDARFFDGVIDFGDGNVTLSRSC